MTQRDVDLIIRAKNLASKEVDQAAESLERLEDQQTATGASAKKLDTLLGQLAAEFNTLKTVSGNIQSLDKIREQAERASQAFARQQDSLAKSQQEMTDLARSQEMVVMASGRLQAEVQQNAEKLRAETQAVAAAKKELQAYSTAANKAARDANAAESKLAEARKRFAEKPTDPNATKVVDAAIRVREAQEAARAAALTQAKLTETYSRQQAQLVRNREAHSALVTSLNEVQSAERNLTKEIAKTDTAIKSQADNIAKSESEYAQLTQIVARAEATFTQAARQQGVYGQSAAQVSQQLTILKAKMQELQAAQKSARTGAKFLIDPEAIRAGNAGLREAMTTIRAATNEAAKGSVTLQQLGSAVEQLARSAQQLRQLQDGLAKQERSAAEARDAWKQAEAEVKRLAQALQQAGRPSEALAAALGAAQGQARAAKDAFRSEQQALESLSAQLRAAGFSHDNLAEAQAVLARRSEATSTILLRGRAALIGFGSGGEAAARGGRNAAKGIGEVPPAANKASASLKDLIRQLSGVEDQGRQSLSLFQRFRGQLLSLAAATGGVFAVQSAVQGVVNAQLELEAVQSRFSVAFQGDQTKVDRALEFTRATADELGLSFKTLALQYSRLTAASLGTNLEGEKTEVIFRSISEAARVLRLTDEEVAGSFKALTDIMSKGTIQAEELKGQLGDRFPGAVQIMAKALGIGTEELAKMMEQGQLTSDALLDFATEISKRVAPALPEAMKSASASFERLRNSIFDVQTIVAQSGFVDALAKGAEDLAAALRDPALQQGLRDLGEGLADFIRFSAQAIPYMGELLDALKVLAVFMVARFVGGALVDTVAGLARLRVAIGLTQASLSKLPAALKAVNVAAQAAGGGFGGFVAALGKLGLVRYGLYGVIAAEIYTIADAAYEAYKANEELAGQIDKSNARAAKASETLKEKSEAFARAQAEANGSLVKAQNDVALSAESVADMTTKIAQSYGSATGSQQSFIKSSAELIKMTNQEIDAYQDLLIARLRVIGERRTQAMMGPDSEENLRIIREVDAEERKIQAVIRETALIEQGRAAALQKTSGEMKTLEQTTEQASRQADLLEARMQAVAELNFNNSILALEKVQNAKLAALTISGADEAKILAATTQFEEQRLNLVRQYSQKQLQLVDQDVQRRKAILDRQKLDDKARADELVKIDDAASKARVQIVQQEVQAVSQAREQALGRYMAALQRVADLDRRIADLRLQGEFQVLDIRRSAMGEYQSYLSRQAEMTKLNGRIQEEIARGNLEVAESLAQRQLQLAQSLNQEVKEGEKVVVSKEQAAQNAVSGTEKANQNLITVLQKRRDIEKAEAEQQKKLYENLTATLERLNKTLARMSGAQEIDIPLTVDEQQAKSDLENTVSQMKAVAFREKVGVPVTADTRDYVQKFDSEVLSKDGSFVRVGVFLEDGAYKLKVNEIKNDEIVATARVEFSGTDLDAAIARAKQIVEGDFPTMQLAFDSAETFAQFETFTADVKRQLSEDSFLVTAQFQADDAEVQAVVDKYKATVTPTGVQFVPDTAAADQARANLAQPIIVPVQYVPTNSVPKRSNGGILRVPGFANGGSPGGLISGPGTTKSDSILAAVSNKEYIVRAVAVKKYGQGFMNALNAGAISPDRLKGVMSGGPQFEATLNLNINGQAVGTLSGSRQTVNNFVEALTELQRQLGNS